MNKGARDKDDLVHFYIKGRKGGTLGYAAEGDSELSDIGSGRENRENARGTKDSVARTRADEGREGKKVEWRK